jgi:hypothetical protein
MRTMSTLLAVGAVASVIAAIVVILSFVQANRAHIEAWFNAQHSTGALIDGEPANVVTIQVFNIGRGTVRASVVLSFDGEPRDQSKAVGIVASGFREFTLKLLATEWERLEHGSSLVARVRFGWGRGLLVCPGDRRSSDD